MTIAFHGRVVTGAGAGLGRAHALLEARGAVLESPGDPDAVGEAWPRINDHRHAVPFFGALEELQHIYAATGFNAG